MDSVASKFEALIVFFSLFYLAFNIVASLAIVHDEPFESRLKVFCYMLAKGLFILPLFVAIFALMVKLIIFVSLSG